MRAKLLSKEKTPLLLSGDDQITSDGTGRRSSRSSRHQHHQGGIRRIFTRSSSYSSQNDKDDDYQEAFIDDNLSMDTREFEHLAQSILRAPTGPEQALPTQQIKRMNAAYARSETSPIRSKQQTAPLRKIHLTPPRQSTNNITPPRKIRENAKDSYKKERPFPVPTRRVRSNPDATDPPANSFSTDSAKLQQQQPQQQRRFVRESRPVVALRAAITTTTADTTTTTSKTSVTSETSNNTCSTTDSCSDEKKVEDRTNNINTTMVSSVTSVQHISPISSRAVLQEEVSYYKQQQQQQQEIKTILRKDNTNNNKVASGLTLPEEVANNNNSKKKKSSVRLTKARELLSRPFGRDSIPPQISRKWVVELSAPEWDADEGRWKYRILIQTRQLASENDQDKTSVSSQQQQHHSFTQAYTWRSLSDFLWLEQALRDEFCGGLLLPDLGVALGLAVETNLEGMPVEAEKLRNWLSDVLNGVRGQGEFIITSHGNLEVIKTESMEAFLYKNAGSLQVEEETSTFFGFSTESLVGDASKAANRSGDSFIKAFFINPLAMMPLELCVGPYPPETSTPSERRSNQKVPLGMMACSSRALGSATSLEVQDSFAESLSVSSPKASNSLAFHSEVIEAEKELLLDYRKTALSAMEKLQNLQDHEEKIGSAWRRLAVALSSLFSFEKEVEHARLKDVKTKKENMPFRKLSKSSVEECLRILARQKVERATPALDVLHKMLAAYVADLSAVEPNVASYTNAVFRLMNDENDAAAALRHATSRSSQRHADEIHTDRVLSRDDSDRTKLLKNELLLRHVLTEMCKVTPMRVSRMAWKYWSLELDQCKKLNDAASSLRGKVDVANKDALSKMIGRHLQEEKEDNENELELVQKLLNIRKIHKFPASRDDVIVEEDSHVEFDTDDHEEERAAAARREKAMQIAKERVGRWNSNLAMAIMQAVDIDDPQIRNDEAHGDLRMIRKYAVGLREHLNRCFEAVQGLTDLLSGEIGSSGSLTPNNRQKSLRQRREEFWLDISKLFSGVFSGHMSGAVSRRFTPSTSVLVKAGVDVNDSFGWIPTSSKVLGSRAVLSQTSLGNLGAAYINSRDEQTEWILSSLAELLRDYNTRIEIVEGFVYMECVGIQIEKCFSQKRATALAAFEKKTDLTAAINVARRKRLPKLLRELQAKLDALGPAVSHTTVKEMKEIHLESKNMKMKLHDAAMRRILRARETSTEKVVAMLNLWAAEEEKTTSAEQKILEESISLLERAVGKEDIGARLDPDLRRFPI